MLTNSDQENLLNAILEWGKTHILTPVFTQDLKEIEDYCQTVFSQIDLKSFLSELTRETDDRVNSAIKTLSDPKLIIATETDDLWHDAEKSFLVFDRVNYLIETTYHLIAPYNKSLSEEVMSKLDDIMSRIISWLEDGEFSPLRLTVINSIRRGYVNLIPEDERYQFPWYEIYSDYDENIIRVIIEHFDDLTSRDKKGQIPKELKTYLPEISYELKRDKELLSIINQEFVLHRSLLETVSKRSALTLWHLGDEAALDYILPEEVEKAGVVRVSISLLKKVKLSTKTEKLYWAFLVAFCGPGLKNEQRLQLLDEVERMIGKIDTEDLVGDMAKILVPLKRWHDEKLQDDWLTQICFTHWLELLEKEAVAMPEMECDEDPNRLWEVLKSIVSFPDLIPDLILVVLKWTRERIISPKVELGAVPVPEMGDKKDRKTIKIETKTNPINLSIRPNDKGEYPILPAPKFCVGGNIETYETSLWNEISKITGVYWGGVAITEDDESEKFTPQPIDRRIFHRISGKGYQKAIIGISSDEDQLERFIQKLTEAEPKIDETFDKIILLIISLERGNPKRVEGNSQGEASCCSETNTSVKG